jgi:hypothetical protein
MSNPLPLDQQPLGSGPDSKSTALELSAMQSLTSQDTRHVAGGLPPIPVDERPTRAVFPRPPWFVPAPVTFPIDPLPGPGLPPPVWN